jgi:hypothetical protein
MSDRETTPSTEAPAKRRWIVKVAAAALIIAAIACWIGAGEGRPQQFVGMWAEAARETDAPERRLEYLADGTFWTYSAGVKRYEGTWHGSERELVVVTDTMSSQRPSVGGWLERLAQFALNPSGSRRSVKFDVARKGELMTLTLTDEFGAPPQKPQEITFKRVAE